MTPTVVVHHAADGERVTVYPSKRAARAAGVALRESGAVAFVYGEVFYRKFIAKPHCHS